MTRNLYLHEVVDIVGQGQYEYMEHLWQDPVLRMPEMFSLQGSFYVCAAGGGRWPQVINIWDAGTRGWDVNNQYMINGGRNGTSQFLLNGAPISDKDGTWQLAPNGLPAALADFAPTSAQIRPIERGCGLLEARHPDGRQAMLLFDAGTEDEWGPPLLYVISTADGTVLEWAGDGSRCGVEATDGAPRASPPRQTDPAEA